MGEVTVMDLAQRVTVSGKVSPWRKSVISAPYAGYVEKLFVKIGQKVKAGESIVSVRPELRTLGEDLFPLRTTLAGEVVQILKLEGDAVNPNSDDAKSLVRIDDSSRWQVTADVPEIEIMKLREGQEVMIKASAMPEQMFKGVIKSISLAAKTSSNRWDSSGVEFPITIEVTGAAEGLRSGMSVVIDIIARKVDKATALRLEYIQREDNGDAFVTMADGKRRAVKLGMQTDEAAQVLDGLKAGDKVQLVDFLSLAKPSAGQMGRGRRR